MQSPPLNCGFSAIPIQRVPTPCLRLAMAIWGESKIAEAQAVWAEVMKIAPDFSIERRRRILPFRRILYHFE